MTKTRAKRAKAQASKRAKRKKTTQSVVTRFWNAAQKALAVARGPRNSPSRQRARAAKAKAAKAGPRPETRVSKAPTKRPKKAKGAPRKKTKGRKRARATQTRAQAYEKRIASLRAQNKKLKQARITAERDRERFNDEASKKFEEAYNRERVAVFIATRDYAGLADLLEITISDAHTAIDSPEVLVA